MHHFRALSCGNLASVVLSAEQPARVLGVTSQGVFLRSASKWLVFVSAGGSHGPLTVTLQNTRASFSQVKVGAKAQFGDESIIILEADMVIDLNGCRLWKPVAPPTSARLNFELIADRLAQAQRAVAGKKGVASISWLLSRAQHARLPRPDSEGDFLLAPHRVLQIQASLRDQGGAGLHAALPGLLGLGAGLTPAGDDFILGFLLCLNRWQGALSPGVDLESLNRQMVRSAYRRTTQLSANLIECATLGLADERLVNGLDWLLSGETTDPDVLGNLLGWGNSSGVSVLAGFATALSGSMDDGFG